MVFNVFNIFVDFLPQLVITFHENPEFLMIRIYCITRVEVIDGFITRCNRIDQEFDIICFVFSSTITFYYGIFHSFK